jgi:hypothetical protein
MPAWATSITHERWSAGMVRNHGRSSSMRATARVAMAPDARSSRRSVAAVGGWSITRWATPVSVSRPGASGRVGE